jgi:hypothetical protein
VSTSRETKPQQGANGLVKERMQTKTLNDAKNAVKKKGRGGGKMVEMYA